MTTTGGVAAPAADVGTGPAESGTPRRRTARGASIVLAAVILLYTATQQTAPPSAEPPIGYEVLLLLVAAFYTALLTHRWMSPHAEWWVGIVQGIAAFVLALLMASMTTYVAPLIAAGYVVVIVGRALFDVVSRGARARTSA